MHTNGRMPHTVLNGTISGVVNSRATLVLDTLEEGQAIGPI